MTTKCIRSVMVCMCLVALAPAVLAGAGKAPATGPDGAVAEIDITSDVIVWEPLVEFRQVALRVSGESGVFERTFEPGETIYFDFVASDGTVLKDGTYTYELVASPLVSVSRDEEQSDAAAEEVRRLLKGQPTTQSGSFTISDGRALIPTDNEEGLSFRVVLTNGDGVIRNSLCVGFDCPDSPSFSDTTILLMENNTRIKFDDTSTISGFPNRDWSLVANDSASGGTNRFFIQDCGNSSQGGCSGNAVFNVEAGARNNAVWIDNGNRVGFGTSTPVVDGLHFVTGNTPALRLEQNGSSGFAPQTWDVAGNETSFFIRDATNGSTLPFRIRPGAPSSSIDISASGDVGFGTTSPVSNGITVHGGSANEAIVKLCHNASGCGSTTDGANLALSGSDLFYTNRENGDLFFFTNNQQKMVLDNGNNHTITGNLTVNGDLSATGAKPFITPDPSDPSHLIRYVAMEGPEAALFVRGSVQLVDGKARIQLPKHFTVLAVEKTMTVSLTPRSVDSLGLAAAEVTSDHIDVAELAKGRGSYQVDYVVYAVRLGYEDYPVYLPRK